MKIEVVCELVCQWHLIILIYDIQNHQNGLGAYYKKCWEQNIRQNIYTKKKHLKSEGEITLFQILKLLFNHFLCADAIRN